MCLTGMQSWLITGSMLLSLKSALKTRHSNLREYSEHLNMISQLLNSMNNAIIKARPYLLGRVSSMRKNSAVLHLLTGTKIEIVGRQILQLSYFSWILELFIGSNKIQREKQFISIKVILYLVVAMTFTFTINAMSMDHHIHNSVVHTNFPRVWIMALSNQRVT